MAPELLREIHFAKQRRTIAAFCRRLTAEEWLGCFREHGDFDRLPGRIFRRWALLRKSILLGENRIDHKLPVIAELEDPAADLEAGLDAVHKEQYDAQQHHGAGQHIRPLWALAVKRQHQ